MQVSSHQAPLPTLGIARRADDALRQCFAKLSVEFTHQLDWNHYDQLVAAIEYLDGEYQWPQLYRFQYHHPVSLQDAVYGLGKSYTVSLSYADSGRGVEPVVAIGGLTNAAQRFRFISIDAIPELRIYSLELAGRGRSGWLAELTDYTLESYVEQLRQFIDHVQLRTCTLLGSSLGAVIAMRFTKKYPSVVTRIIFNDSSPYIPSERRARRAKAVGRYYTFHKPSEMFRRTGASAKAVGPALDAVMLNNAHHKTRWSEDEQARIYRHDIRSLLAYRAEATESLDRWDDWKEIHCPVLVVHGLESDATSIETINEMRQSHDAVSVIHINQTGHTPTLSDFELNRKIVDWIRYPEKFVDNQIHTVAYQPKRILYLNE